MSPRFKHGLWVFTGSAGTLVLAGCAQIFGIDDAHEIPAPRGDASSADAAHGKDAGGRDATGATDAHDATAHQDAPAATDASDAAHPSDGSHPSDAPQTCAERVAAALSAPIVPPVWGGFDLSNGGDPNLPSGGGLTVQATGLAACASYAEPLLLGAGVDPIYPGYRATDIGSVQDSGPATSWNYSLSFESNLSTGVIGIVLLQDGYTGTFSFHSRPGGAYGQHTYEVAIGAAAAAPADGGPAVAPTGGGYVKRDGVSFPADWSSPLNDAGRQEASPWANEIYDGIIATYSPGTAAIHDCRTTPSTEYSGVIESYARDSCLYVPNAGGLAYLGVRSIPFYMTFNVGTNQVTVIYSYWRGGDPDCTAASKNATREQMDYGPVGAQQLAGLFLYQQDSNPLGLTEQESDDVLCNGVAGSFDGGAYGTLVWGENNEVTLEYNKPSSLDFTLSAVNSSYRGSLVLADNVGNIYTLTIGASIPITAYPDGGANPVPVGTLTIDWPASAATTPAAETLLANALCGASDTDCVAGGNCAVSYDSSGAMTMGFTCGAQTPLTGVVFPSQTSVPSRFFVTNANGQ